MSKYFIITLPLAIISWCVVLKNQVSVGWCTALFAYIGTIFSILTICFLIVSISKKLIPKASPYKIFAISVSIIGVLTFLYAIYDIKTSTGLFAGLFGTLSDSDKKSLINEVLNGLDYNFIVTPKEVDFQIDRLSSVISSGINGYIHGTKVSN